MFKQTPNPPEDPTTSPYESIDSKKLHEAAERALDHHLGTPPPKIHLADARKGQLFIVAPGVDTDSLLANASEDIASIKAIAGDLAFEIEGSRRNVALAIYRMAEGAQLLIDRAMDNLDPPNPVEYRVKV
ncbi:MULTISPECIES: DUF6124 family protein [unclassified Pseudomonas]|uniref:DUF6124 family protein n=1 Tax=unclassified Pseudomonas TaxID=196821 RepID=UPI000CD2E287|nr:MULTISPECIES: DUF6124 family protein [unclassified Pseudomonas]POA34881.1 hypothetical protein C1887_01995 [Pseudomonas sp. GW456-R21]POA63413.1 hypothetical protein C1884_24495 [Pseudomonas sp. GW460-R15]